MPIKTLPAVGDSNWGSTLNNYITQTTNNTNGGGFNSFTNFADRPTNLTADDKGKTYLNTKSGNFHTWDGVKWVVNHTGDAINIMDFGTITNSNDTAVVQAAIDYIQTQGASKTSRLFLPAGNYRFEVEINGKQTITIYGAGAAGSFDAQTIVSAINPDGYAFTFHCTSEQKLEDMTITGESPIDFNIKGYSNGVKCIPGIGPQNSGFNPVLMKNVTITECKIGLYKKATLYGKFENCSFRGCDIGTFCIGGGQLYATNYSGFDKWDHCGWFGCQKVCVYYDNSNNYDEARTTFDNCYFENNFGSTLIAIGTGGAYSLKMKSCWFEANIKRYGQNVVIDGKTYPVGEFYLDNSKCIIDHAGTSVGTILKNQSYMRIDYGGVSGDIQGSFFDDVQVDASSYLDLGIVGGDGFGGVHSNVSAELPILYFQRLDRCMSQCRSNNHRSLITKNYKNVTPHGSMSVVVPPNLAGSSTVATLISGDGLYNNKCVKVSLPTGQKYAIKNDSKDLPDGGYSVFSYSIKSLMSVPINVNVVQQALGAGVKLKDNNWHTYSGVCLSGGFSRLEFGNVYTSANPLDIEFLISKIQTVRFNTFQDAVDYLKSDFYALPAEDPQSWHDLAIPTSGVYARGDVIYNIAPTVGGYMGWTCVSPTVLAAPATNQTPAIAAADAVWYPFGEIVIPQIYTTTPFAFATKTAGVSVAGNVYSVGATASSDWEEGMVSSLKMAGDGIIEGNISVNNNLFLALDNNATNTGFFSWKYTIAAAGGTYYGTYDNTNNGVNSPLAALASDRVRLIRKGTLVKAQVLRLNTTIWQDLFSFPTASTGDLYPKVRFNQAGVLTDPTGFGLA